MIGEDRSFRVKRTVFVLSGGVHFERSVCYTFGNN